MTAKAKINKEQEAIDSIMLLMRHIDSDQGIQELTSKVVARGKEIMGSRLTKAKEEVRNIESHLRSLEGSEEESVGYRAFLGERPRFRIAKTSEEVEKTFLKAIADDAKFTAGDVKSYLKEQWNIPEEESNYLTENGGNILSSNIRTALNRLHANTKIKRIKPGVYIKKNVTSTGNKSNWSSVVSWETSKVN